MRMVIDYQDGFGATRRAKTSASFHDDDGGFWYVVPADFGGRYDNSPICIRAEQVSAVYY